jgi:hypothetical protein
MFPRVLTNVLKITPRLPGPGRTVTSGGRPRATVRTPTTSPVTSVTVQAWPGGSAPVPPPAAGLPGAAGAELTLAASVAAAARSAVPRALLSDGSAMTAASAMPSTTADRSLLMNASFSGS